MPPGAAAREPPATMQGSRRSYNVMIRLKLVMKRSALMNNHQVLHYSTRETRAFQPVCAHVYHITALRSMSSSSHVSVFRRY